MNFYPHNVIKERSWPFYPVRGVQVFTLLLYLAIIALAGCKKEPGLAALDSDANGYVCTQCGAKFYTDRKVFAEFCPNCKSTNIRPVVGYVCDKCQHVTLSTQAHTSVTCEQCQALVAASKLPSAAELAAWGAVKKTKAEVCGP